MNKKGFIELSINYSGNLGVTKDSPEYAYLTKEKYNQMCDRYGTYGFGWYFVSSGTIKVYDGKSWDYIYK